MHMSKPNEWKLVQKIQASERRGIILGLVIAVTVLAITTIAIVKYRWIKNKMECLHYDLDDLDDDFDDDDDDDDEHCCDENGCCIASDKDFV